MASFVFVKLIQNQSSFLSKIYNIFFVTQSLFQHFFLKKVFFVVVCEFAFDQLNSVTKFFFAMKLRERKKEKER